MSIMEMLSRINRFYKDGKLDTAELDSAAESIRKRREEDPTMARGTELEALFASPREPSTPISKA